MEEINNGKTINYTVREVGTPSGYEITNIKDSSGNVRLTNKHTPETTQVSGKKTWNDNDNQDAICPKSIQVQLYANNVKKCDVVTLNEGNDWTHTWGVIWMKRLM